MSPACRYRVAAIVLVADEDRAPLVLARFLARAAYRFPLITSALQRHRHIQQLSSLVDRSPANIVAGTNGVMLSFASNLKDTARSTRHVESRSEFISMSSKRPESKMSEQPAEPLAPIDATTFGTKPSATF